MWLIFLYTGACSIIHAFETTPCNYTVSIRIVTNADTTTMICSVSTRRRYSTVAHLLPMVLMGALHLTAIVPYARKLDSKYSRLSLYQHTNVNITLHFSVFKLTVLVGSHR